MPFIPDQQQAQQPGRFVPDQSQQAATPPRSRTEAVMRQFGIDIKHAAGRTARMGAEAVGAIPLMAADFGVAARNLGENVAAGRPAFGLTRELPSQQYQRGLDQIGLPRPQGAIEKVTDVAGQMMFGSRLPVPSVSNPAPANFVSAMYWVTDESPVHVSLTERIDDDTRERLLAGFEDEFRTCLDADGNVTYDAPYVVVTALRR
jgi:hypothetical protein